MFDRSGPENPYATWTQVYVPYCSGDAHIGHADLASLKLRGFDNAVSVLSAVTAEAPSEVALTGGSAGGSGAFSHIATLAQLAEPAGTATWSVVDNASVSARTPALNTEIYAAWSVEVWLDAVGYPDVAAPTGDGTTTLSPWLAEAVWTPFMMDNPGHPYTYVGYVADATQASEMGLDEPIEQQQLAFHESLVDVLDAAAAEGIELTHYIQCGTDHTSLAGPAFYEVLAEQDLTPAQVLAANLEGAATSAACADCLTSWEGIDTTCLSEWLSAGCPAESALLGPDGCGL